MRCFFLHQTCVLSCCAAAVALSGCYSMNGYVMNASGLGYYDRGNYAMAAEEFQAAVSSNPQNPDYLANLAKARLKLGDPGTAEQLYRQALSVDPSHQPAYHGYAELLLAQNRSQEALRMLNTWAATQPYVAESHVELAWLQRELGQEDAAVQTLQTALQTNPNHATALAQLGQIYQDRGNATQAVALYQRSLRADWDQPDVHSRMAVAAQAAGASHPMSEMAMARGVHPYSIPRPQTAFGPQMPSGVAPVPQMAWQPPANPPWTGGRQPSPQQNAVAVSGIPATAYMSPPPFTTGPVSTSSPMTHNPTQSFGIPTPSDSAPLPVPDPEFSDDNKGIPATSVSESQVVEESAAADELQPAQVEAF